MASRNHLWSIGLILLLVPFQLFPAKALVIPLPARSAQKQPPLEAKQVGTALASPVHAQGDESFAKEAAKIMQAANRNSRVMDILRHLTDRIGPRLSGSPGAEAAVQWTAARMRADGLENVSLQPVKVPHWIRGEESGELLTPVRQELSLTALGGSVATPRKGLTAEVIEVGSFQELAERSNEVKGKIVYFHSTMDPSLSPFEAYGRAVVFRARGAIEAARHGAVGSLIRSLATVSLRTPHTGAMRYDSSVPRIPHAALSTEDGDLIHRLISEGVKPTLRFTLTPRQVADVESANVIGELPGRERPDEIVLLGAHLDSWDLGTGAFDDGAGCALVMEAPRLLKELGLVPRRTIRVVLFMDEETGLRGARRYAELSEDELRSHVAAIEADAGADRPLGFSVSQGGKPLELIRKWVKMLEPIGATNAIEGGFGGADIGLLGRRGVLALGLLQDPTRYFFYHHSAADTYDKVSAEAMQGNLAAMAFMAYALAETTEDLPHKPVHTSTRGQ
jgi:hypothetical protein